MSTTTLWQQDLADLCPWIEEFLNAGELSSFDRTMMASRRRRASIERAEYGSEFWNRWATRMMQLRFENQGNELIDFACTTNWERHTFDERLDLAGCLFPGSVHADDISLIAGGYFSACEVFGDFNMRNAYIAEDGVWLDQMKVYGGLRLRGSQIDGRLEMRNSVIARTTDLSELLAQNEIWATGCRFMEDVTAAYARFASNVSFNASRFSEGADFSSCVFEDVVSFQKSRFEGPASFEGCIFEDKLWLTNAFFNQEARMGEARFRCEINLDGVTFGAPHAANENRFLEDFTARSGLRSL